MRYTRLQLQEVEYTPKTLKPQDQPLRLQSPEGPSSRPEKAPEVHWRVLGLWGLGDLGLGLRGLGFSGFRIGRV